MCLTGSTSLVNDDASLDGTSSIHIAPRTELRIVNRRGLLPRGTRGAYKIAHLQKIQSSWLPASYTVLLSDRFEAYQTPIPLKMHISTLLATILFVTAAVATPYPWAAPQASLAPTPSGVRKHNRTHRNRHKEPTPTFKEGCECAMPVVPMNLLSANERCLMKQAAAMGCYLSSKGGCPSPAPAVSTDVKNE